MFRDNLAVSNLDVSRFHTSNVETMSGMFENCNSIKYS